MSTVPELKVYDAHGKYQAACKEIEAAAALADLYGEGATIRWGHSKKAIVWTEGREIIPAGDSYDGVVQIVWPRMVALEYPRSR